MSVAAPPRAELIWLRSYVKLFKFRIVALLVFTALVVAEVAGEGNAPLDKILTLAIAGGIASIGAGVLNHYFDRDLDGQMGRTKARPLPACEIRPSRVLYLGVILLGASLIISINLNFLASLFILLGAVVYVLVYTLWLKRKSSLNIVIGGLSGAFAALAGWAAINPELSITPILIALVLFLWTPSHFWCFAILQKDNYKKAGIPMLPVVVGEGKASKCILANTLVLAMVSLLLYFQGTFGYYYLSAALSLGAIFVYLNVKQVIAPSVSLTWKNYKFSGVYLLLLLLAMALDAYL